MPCPQGTFVLNKNNLTVKKRAPVSQIMSTELISLNLTNELADAVMIFKQHNIHHIPVVSGEEIIGLVSKTDIDRISFVDTYQEDTANTAVYTALTLDQVMTRNLETINTDDQIKTAAEILAEGNFHALPVLENGKLAGIVTSTDVIRYLLDQY